MLRKKNCCFNIPKQHSIKLEIENEFAPTRPRLAQRNEDALDVHL